MRRRGLALATVLMLVAAHAASMQAAGRDDPINPESVAALERWIEAVKHHTPGRIDAAVTAIRGLTFDDRRVLNGTMGPFLALLTRAKGSTRRLSRTPAVSRLARLAEEIRLDDAVASFLQRAAVLHGDAAMAAPIKDASNLESRGFVRSGRADAPEESPLLFRGRMLAGFDGEVRGEMSQDWNWVFARFVLERKPFQIAGSIWPRAFVADWYHATAAYMFRNGLFGEASSHLLRAGTVLEDDGRVLFDRGCLAEAHGLPAIQQVVNNPLTGRTRLPSAESVNSEAERFYRRALAIDPALAEARVRLARLLTLRGRYDKAQGEAETALGEGRTGAVAFYAHLFAGRAARARGQNAAAGSHFRDALALYPGAQSALLGASQAALLGNDVAGAVSLARRLAELADQPVDQRDPWWIYRWCTGRDADALLAALWARVRQ